MVFTSVGKNQVRNWLAGSSSTAPVAIAVGTGSTAATVDDTALGYEVFRKSTTDSLQPFLVTFEMVMATTDLTSSEGLTEYGLFNNTSSTSGELFIRNTFAEIEKTNAIEIQFEQRVAVE